MPINDWTVDELMVVELSKQIADKDVIHCGAYTPLVLAAALLAKSTHAPDAVILPISVSCARTDKVFPMTMSLLEAMGLGDSLFYKMSDIFHHVEGEEGVGFEPISPVQIDRYGNFNNTVLGDYHRPRVRLPGAAGMDILPIMPTKKLAMYVPRHSARVFVEKCDFVTGIGFGDGPGGRERAGVKGEGGPSVVITNLGTLDFEPESKQMRLIALNPGATLEEVQQNTGFPLRLADEIAQVPPPPGELVKLLRNEIDVYGIRKFEFMTAKERRAVIGEMLDREEADYLGPPVAA